MKSYRKTVIFDIVVTFVILAVTFFASLVLNDLFEANTLIPSMFVLAVFAAVLLLLCPLQDGKLRRWAGIVMLLCYAAYFAIIL